ncbi:MAG: molecular chaperone, partial [Oscillospiraceae bacterium]|nr:molecular chaperone [Oscillospiraceae bacterium]
TNLRWRDTALDLRAGDYGTPLMPEDTILMEIKIPGAAPLWLARLLSENRMFPTSFSKYGTYYKDVVLGMGPKDVSKKEVLSCA